MDDTPMRLVERIASLFRSKVSVCIDVDYKICVYIPDIDRIRKKKYLSNLEGRGFTYQEACINYLINVLDKRYNLRYKKKYYATSPIREIIRSNKIFMNEYYLKGGDKHA